MDGIVELSWRLSPATALMIVGGLLFLAGVRRNRWGWRSPYGDPEKMVLWIQGFRLAEVGFTRRVLGAAWLWERFPSRRQGALGLCAGIRRRGGAGGERPPLDRAVRQSPLG